MSSSIRMLSVNWSSLKAAKARDVFDLYYISSDSCVEVVGPGRNFVYRSTLLDGSDISDFTTNFQSAAFAVESIDDAISIANDKAKVATFGMQIVTREGDLNESAFGHIKAALEDLVISAQFTSGIFPDSLSHGFVGTTSDISISNSKLKLSTGTAVGRATVLGARDIIYAAGIGVHSYLSFILGDTGSAGCVRTWGFGDNSFSNGYYFQLDGTTLQIIRKRAGAVVETITADNWNKDNTIIPDTNGHIWTIQFQWLGVGRIIFKRDLKVVHIIEYVGTSNLLSMENPNGSIYIDIENSSVQGVARYSEVGCIGVAYENGLPDHKVYGSHTAINDQIVNISTGTYNPIIGLKFLKTRLGKSNNRLAFVSRVAIATDKDLRVRIKTNAEIIGTGVAHSVVNDPSVEWENHTSPLTADVSSTDATGSGYSDGDSVAYKITATGNVGETLPSDPASVVDVGTPKKQVDLNWSPISKSSAYNVYRQVGGSGNFEFIGRSSGSSFTDNAYNETSATPPGTNTTEGVSFIQEFRNPTEINGGRVTQVINVAGGGTTYIELTHENGVLGPGNTIAIEADPSAVATVTALIDWLEAEI